MNEMLEVSSILNNADSRSLIVLDEVGRGTSTYDGIAISRAIIEYILDNIRARTLVDDPPLHLKEGGLIKEGVDPALDQLRYYRDNAQRLIPKLPSALPGFKRYRKFISSPSLLMAMW